MKNIIIAFGGVSPEHEVSVITGLQVLENMDRKKYSPHAVLITQKGEFKYFPNLRSRKDFLETTPKKIYFSRDDNGSYFNKEGFLKSKVYVDAAFMAFHGGGGEAGLLQGFFESLNIPFTSPNVEGSAISMNKVLTKEILESHGVKTVPWERIFDANADKINIKLPVIIKPAHLGSSIAINIAKTKVELKKYLLEASQVDDEILVEKLVKNFTEYNIAVRKIGNKIETSEIEKPLSEDAILSFADKYQKGGKKSGMASLNRELPAAISSSLEKEIQEIAIKVFRLLRLKGMVRIDFMYANKMLYVTEVNPIPGSMSFYLWEASGVSFKHQITDLIEQAIVDAENKNSLKLEYKTDIIEKFVSNKDR